MVTLLGQIRKQMNGAVLDTFRYYGQRYGMNYGVAIHTLRQMAQQQGIDDSLAQFLYRQQVRELQIIALWIADASKLEYTLDFWAAGIINSELAEQAAQALMCRYANMDNLLERLSGSDSELVVYAALLAASRGCSVGFSAVERAVLNVVERFGDNHLAVKGISVLLASQIANARTAVARLLKQLPDCKTSAAVVENVAWQLNY